MQRRARKIKNENFSVGDPRRWEPGLGSIKRLGANWRERWQHEVFLRYLFGPKWRQKTSTVKGR